MIEEDGVWIIDDAVRSNNGDMPRIIATVAKITGKFLRENKDVLLSFSGFMDHKSLRLARNQRLVLYQRVVDSNFFEWSRSLEITGIINGQPEGYVVGKTYDSILIGYKI